MGVDTAVETQVLCIYAAEGGTTLASLELRSKTEKWDLSPMGDQYFNTLTTPTLTLNVLKELAQGK